MDLGVEPGMNADGSSPPASAAGNWHAELVKLLLEKGANVTTIDIGAAYQSGIEEVIEMLENWTEPVE